MRYTFDESGSVCGYSTSTDGTTWTAYYYVKNIQGDVIEVFRASDNVSVATFKYDSWGFVLSAKGTNATENPFRYRGYYYDVESKFYYLQSRYYDPELGRFLNPDSLVSTGQGVLGCNMFAYCLNNPVNMYDYSGNWPQWIEDGLDWLDENIVQPGVAFINEIVEDIKNYDSNNQSEQKVLDSNYFSSYKGVPVFRIEGNRSGSFGAMFITRETNSRPHPEDVIRHEYGHTVQLEQLGIVKYALCIGLPSWQEWGSEPNYYARPWEITADILGGVESRNHNIGDIYAGFKYLQTSDIIGPFIWVFIE